MYRHEQEHIVLAGSPEDGLCCGPGGVHGMVGGMIFGTEMTTVSPERQFYVQENLRSAGYLSDVKKKKESERE